MIDTKDTVDTKDTIGVWITAGDYGKPLPLHFIQK